MSQNAYPQPVANYKIDMKVDGSKECETASTCSPTPRSVVTSTPSEASSWRSPEACPRRLSAQSNVSQSPRRGSLFPPDATPPSRCVRAQSASPRSSHTSIGDVQEHRRARSSSPRPSLRSAADANQQMGVRGSRN
jgi:hypothetical protein